MRKLFLAFNTKLNALLGVVLTLFGFLSQATVIPIVAGLFSHIKWLPPILTLVGLALAYFGMPVAVKSKNLTSPN